MKKTYYNSLDLEYRYQHMKAGGWLIVALGTLIKG